MEKVHRLDNVADYNQVMGQETLNPLVSLIDISSSPRQGNYKRNFGFYIVYLKEVKCGNLRYGCNYYDYQEGTLVFVAPGQVIGLENDGTDFQPKGYALLFHPDLIRGTSLGKHIHDYSFFSYEVFEALHLSESERKVVMDCLHKIQLEIQRPVDKHSKKLIVSNIELFLDYCTRFYDRQFITRDTLHKGILQRFDELLTEYFASEKPQTLGLPSVAYSAGELNLSSNYFGDLIKKESGKTAQEYILTKLMDIAKEKIFESHKTMSEIAYELGFKYSQHFSRSFKQHVGYTPNEYRMMN